MTTRVRLSLLFAGFSLVLLVGTLGAIYYSHSQSRQHEFFERLRTQCYRTASLLGDVRAADRDLLRVLDRNSIHRMYDEKVLLFNADDELLYSSLDDEPIPYSQALLDRIRTGGDMQWRDNDGDEVVGVHYTDDGADYVVLASAYDKYGRRELQNLLRTLGVALVLGAVFIFGAGYFFIGMAFRPLERLATAIGNINIDRLDQQLPVRNTKDEIDRLAAGYNDMLIRLRQSFDLQKAFVGNASHELRTPLARMNALVERALALPPGSPEMQPMLATLQADVAGQGQLIESLLLLQQLQAHIPMSVSAVRVDEAIFAGLAEVQAGHPALQVQVDLARSIRSDAQLTVHTNALLLRTAFRNLLVNAALYAPDGKLAITLESVPGRSLAHFTNAGTEPLPTDRLFQPFFRGPGSTEAPGSGLGLSIVRQIAEYAGGSLLYSFNGQHVFTVELPLADAGMAPAA